MIDWSHWSQEPLLAGLLIAVGWAYAVAGGRSVRFFAGLLLAYVTCCGPWERVGRYYLFSAQVLEQMVLIYGASGLILSGLPGEWLDRPLASGPGRWIARHVLRPVPCGAFFVLGLCATYPPRAQAAALASETTFALEHLWLIVVGLLFWWPLITPSRAAPPMRLGPRLAYLFAIEVALAGAFTYLLMAEHPIHPAYEIAPRLIPILTPEDDQLLGGILLSAISSAVLVAVLGLTFYRWAASEKHRPVDHQNRQHERKVGNRR